MSLGVPPVCICGVESRPDCPQHFPLSHDLPASHPLDADGHCEYWHAAIEGFAEAAEAMLRARYAQAEVEILQARLSEHWHAAQEARAEAKRVRWEMDRLADEWAGSYPPPGTPVPRPNPKALDGYPVYACRCPEGPYFGTQKWGTAIACERCGYLTQEQLDAIRSNASDCNEPNRSNACDCNDRGHCKGAESIQPDPTQSPGGLDLLSRDDLMRAMSDNPHIGCPDAGCGPDCPARLHPDGPHDCLKSLGFTHERGNFCKVCNRYILNAELG